MTFDKDHVRMFHKKSQHEVSDLSFWHDTPWVRVVPYEGNDVALNVSPVVASSFFKGGHCLRLECRPDGAAQTQRTSALRADLRGLSELPWSH